MAFFQARCGGDRGPLDRRDRGVAGDPGRCPGLRDGRPLAAEGRASVAERVVPNERRRPLAVDYGKHRPDVVVPVRRWWPLAVEGGAGIAARMVPDLRWRPIPAERWECCPKTVVPGRDCLPLSAEGGVCFPEVTLAVRGWRGVAASVPGLGGLVAPQGRYLSAQGSALGNRGTMMAGQRSANLWL